MKVLLSGGKKTRNILSAISKKFQSSGDEFIIVEFLDDIKDIFARGEIFDKAIITQQSINREHAINDESEIRQRINQFAIDMAARPLKANYVFLTQEENMASIIHEEMLPIFNESVVVFKEPQYSVQFFYELIVKDIRQLPADIVYTPELDEAIDVESEIDTMMDDVNFDEQFVAKEADDNFDMELFGNEGLDVVSAQDEISDELSVDSGEDFQFDVHEEKVEDDTKVEDTGDKFVSGGFDNSDINSDVEIDDTFGLDDGVTLDDNTQNGNNQFNATSDLPDFVENKKDNNSSAFIPGFDEEETTNEPEIDMNDYEVEDNNTTVENQFFDNNMYEPENTEAELQKSFTGNIDYDNSSSGFDESDYDTEYETENNGMEDETYESEYQDGFISGDDYNDEDAKKRELQEKMEQMTNVVDQNTQPQAKKGLIGGLLGKKNTPQAGLVVQQNNTQQPPKNAPKKKGKSIDDIKKALAPFASRGNSIVVTGCGGCGTSTIAYSLSKIISKLGFTVLLVDMDTVGKTQNYISINNYNSMEPDGANLMAAVNSSNGINNHLSVVDQGFHLLTMGIGSDSAEVTDLLHKEKISRFVNSAKTTHNFVIYDIPFKDATNYLSDITYMTDNLVLVLEANNWGVTKAMLNMCNIVSEDMQETMFTRTQLVFNKFRNNYKILGKKVKTCADITRVLDQEVIDLTGDDSGYHFEDLHIAGIINDDPRFNEGWFEEVQFVDTEPGMQIFLDLIERIVLRR